MRKPALERPRVIAIATGVALALSLSGCGGFDGVELNGKIFDAVGLSGDQLGAKKAEPRTQARAPLVMPPDGRRLPDPDEAASVAVADTAWPKDRDAQRVADADAARKAKEQACRDGNWKQKAHKDETSNAEQCQGSIFSWMNNSLFGNKE